MTRFIDNLALGVLIALFLTFCWPGFYDNEDNRPMAEQMAEARERARIGHRIVLNREAIKGLRSGDIVRYWKRLWIVKVSYAGTFDITNFNSEKWCLDPVSRLSTEPGNLEHVYRRGTDEWKRALEDLVAEGVGEK